MSISQHSRALLFTGALWLIATAAGAVVPAYEPFVYSPGPINGKNGNPAGWGGAWVGFADQVTNGGLTYTGLATAGNALGPTPGSASTRALAAPIVGAPGTSMVLSALIRSDVAGTPATQATLGNSSGGTFIIGDLPMPDTAAGNWGFQSSAGRFYSNVPVAANTTAYLVAQIDFDVSGSNDRMRLWVNPPAGAYFTVAPQVDVTNANVGQFSGVFWQTQQQQVVDEIRVYSTGAACVLPPSNTMVGWYPFDETSGTQALNLATRNDGVHINNPAPVPGVVAGALSFDGIGDYVESPSSIVTNFGPAASTLTLACGGNFSSCSGNFSFDAWIRVTPGAASGTLVILDKRAGTVPAIKGYSFFLYQGTLGIQLADGIGTGFSNYLSPVLSPAVDDGNWHHVAATVNRTNNKGIRFYHNGNLVGVSNPLGRIGSLVNNSPLRIGTRTAASPLSGWFDGEIDELEIFNRALKPGEVAGIFNAGPFGKCK
jgi:hypothetical protein